MIAPRWRKVLGDLLGNKTRTALVVLSIAIGVFAIGMVTGGRAILMRDLNGDWNAASPASASISADDIDEELAQVIRRMPGVADAQPSRSVTVRAETPSGEWKDLQLFVIDKAEDRRLFVPTPLSGQWPPERRAVSLERSALPFLGASEGGALRVEQLNGDRYTFTVGGTVYSIGSGPPTSLAQIAYGFISPETAELMGLPAGYTSVDILVAEGRLDEEHIRAVARAVEAKIARSGRDTHGILVLPPGEHPVNSFIQALTMLLGIIGFFAMLLSAFLVINTVGALLTQQTRQIGVMKSLGARSRDIVQLYLVTVLAFGALSLLVAVPLGVLGAYGLAAFFVDLFNFDIATVTPTPGVLALQVAAGLIIPVLASLVPVGGGARLTVREAIGGPGLGKGRFGTGSVDRLLERVRFLSRPMLLSLRNTFRRKGRLALTITTLTLAGTIFMAVISVRASLRQTVERGNAELNSDVVIALSKPYRTGLLDRLAALPGVIDVEHWNSYVARALDAEGEESATTYTITAVPADGDTIRVAVDQGRWLLPADDGAVVLTGAFANDHPELGVGDVARLKVDERELALTVVGISRTPFTDETLYVNRESFSRQVGDVGRAVEVRLIAAVRDPATQERLAAQAGVLLKAEGVEVVSTRSLTQIIAQRSTGINMVILFLLLMAVLLAAVGGLGLMGTMSINVLERTRELGVMRAVGAGNWAIQRIVIAEGVLIGAISWAIGAALALPMSYLMTEGLEVIFEVPDSLSFVFAPAGLAMWLGIVTALAALASFLPAWNASRVTIRDVLAYE